VFMRSINPLAKLLAAVVIGVVLIISLDPVTALVALVIELALLPFVGLSFTRLRKLLTPLLIAAPFAGLAVLLYGRDGGAVWVEIGPWVITTDEVALAATLTIRVIALALPSVVLFATTDPTDLADSLAQLWRLPSRFVLSALAALRMLGMMRQDWHMLTLARRARGIGDGGGPWGALQRMGSRAFWLLVISIRRGSTLAVAMEARGFDAPVQRTWARKAVFRTRDTLFVAGAVFIAAFSVWVSVMWGAWNIVVS